MAGGQFHERSEDTGSGNLATRRDNASVVQTRVARSHLTDLFRLSARSNKEKRYFSTSFINAEQIQRFKTEFSDRLMGSLGLQKINEFLT
jgi:hypothetical protein